MGFLKETLEGFASKRHVTIWYLYCVPILAKLMCNLKSNHFLVFNAFESFLYDPHKKVGNLNRTVICLTAFAYRN